MLVPHLKQYAEALDEANYRVRLQERRDYSANQAYIDGDYWRAPWFEAYWLRVFEARLRALGVRVKPGMHVLDVCCGQGYLGQFLQGKFKAQVTFCDLSLRQLRGLSTRLRPSQPEGSLQVCCADLLHLPYPAESFDLVVGNSFLHHLPDVPAALTELRRVQVPEGGATVLLHEPGTTATFWQSFPRSLFRPFRSLFKRARPTNVSFTDLWLFTPGDLRHLCLQAGYHEVRVMGVGVLSTVLVNWYLLMALQFNWRSRWGVYPAYVLRVWLDQVDRWLQNDVKVRMSPSLMIVAKA